MRLSVGDVVKLYEQAKLVDHNYMVASPSYGVARWSLKAWNIDVQQERLVTWGPVERWGLVWKEHLNYEKIQIAHDDFLIELEAHYGALAYHSSCAHTRSRDYKFYKNHFSLDWCGDVSLIQEVFVYHDLIHSQY